MTYTFSIPVKLPSLNEVIAKNRTNRYDGARLKADIEDDIIRCIIKDRVPKISVPVDILMVFDERTKRRDVDNIQSAQKFILDAMVKAGVLEDDSRRYVRQIYHTVRDGKEDGVKIYITDRALKVDIDEEECVSGKTTRAR